MTSVREQGAAPMPRRPDPETIKRLADVALETMDRHVATAKDLDTKAWQALGAGSIVLGLGISGEIGGVVLWGAMAAYLALAVLSLECMRPTPFSAPPKTEALLREAGWGEPLDVDMLIVDAMTIQGGENANRKTIRRKAILVRFALAALAVETIALTLAAALDL